ncbi:MAG: RNA polymerase sigma-70 factor [Balneolaceae bacterium]|nr:RNA polymerase sigma-70 factor [Balneolaceae bacterium]
MAEKLLARKVRQEGDRNAFEMLFRAYHSRLHGFAYTFVRQSETAEDIIQTIFLNIWADKENWNPPGTVREYLFAAVRNQSLNVLRHQKIVADSEEEIIRNFETMNSSDHLNEHIDYIKFNRQIQVGIEKLPTRCREIYLLNRRCGMTYTEISEYLGLSINTVNTQMGRALKSLRDHLSDFLPVFVAGISKLFL